VRTLDTNVIVRLQVGDDPRQTPIAERAFLAAMASGGVYLPDVLLAEVAWVLRGYDLDRRTRHDLLERLVLTRGVVVDDFDQRFSGHEGVQLLSADFPSTEPPPFP
jgi:predicted nucleic-acid-binding protein